jgi:quercetin dioxygenase-like cupin family protein
VTAKTSSGSSRTTATATRTDLLEVARAFAAAPHRWPTAPKFDPISRWFILLSEDPSAEVWLLTWLPGQATDLHDHGGSAGAFVVVSGEITERVVTDHGTLTESVRTYDAGDGHGFGAHYVHRIVNNSPRPAVTVHAYGPALTSMTRYDISNGRLESVAVDRAGANW